MSIHVYNKEMYHALQQHAVKQSPTKKEQKDSFGESSSFSKSPTRSFGNQSTYGNADKKPLERRLERFREKHDKMEKEQEARTQKVVALKNENIKKKEAKKQAQFLKLCESLDDGRKLAQELQDRIDLQDVASRRRREKLYKNWNDEVYNKIQGDINKKLGEIDSYGLNSQKRAAYQRFLDTSNKKGALFRDIILENEYNPLGDNPSIKSNVKVDDPVSRVLRTREEENAIGNGELTSEKLCNGRNDNLDTKLWASGTFESTPYGYFNKLMNSTASEENSKTLKSKVVFDHYNVPIGKEALQKEIPKGKRTEFAFEAIARKDHIQLG